jgi:hypothetical protein
MICMRSPSCFRACSGNLSYRPSANRGSITTLRPSTDPKSASPCRNASKDGDERATGERKPIRGILALTMGFIRHLPPLAASWYRWVTRIAPAEWPVSSHTDAVRSSDGAALCPLAVDRLRRYFAATRNPGKGHASRVTNLLACSSAKTILARLGTLEDAAVRQVCLTLRLMRLIAQPRVRNWNDRAQELRLLPRV